MTDKDLNTMSQEDVQKQLQERFNQVAVDSYKTGYAEALTEALKPLKELQAYVTKNIEEAERYLKEELQTTQEQNKKVDEEESD